MPASTLLNRFRRSRQTSLNPYLRSITRSFRNAIGTVFVFSFFVNLLSLAVPLYLLQIYDKVLPGRSIDTLMFLTGIALIAVIALGLLESVRRSILLKLGMRLDHQLSEHLLNSAIHRAIAKERASVNIMRDLATLRSFLAGSSIFPILDVPWTPLFLFILYLLHPILGLIGLAGALIMIALALLNEYITREPIQQSGVETRELMDDAQLTIRNADVVQAMGMQTTVLKNWQSRNADALIANYRASRVNTRLSSLSKMVRLFLQIGIICAAAWLIVNHQLSPGVTIASVLLMRRAIGPLEDSIRSWKSVIKARGAYTNISEYLDHATSLVSSSDMPVPSGTLEVHRASFRRSGEDRSVFSRVELRVEPGQICALTGATAAGKSTLLRILAGVVAPTSGKVTLGGYELGQWSAEQLGPHIGYLPQEVGLFAGSVRDNISRLSEASIEEVIEAATLAGAHDMIQALPQGYDTDLSESGLNLSGGQRQRIGLARALFGSPCIVFLDEPDANLDSQGRSTLRKSLRELRRRNIAIVVITHHKSLEKQADRVYHLEDGRVRRVSMEDVVSTEAANVAASPAAKLSSAIIETVSIPAKSVSGDGAPGMPGGQEIDDPELTDDTVTPGSSSKKQSAGKSNESVAFLAFDRAGPVLPPRLQAMERKLKRRLAVERAALRVAEKP